MISLPGTKALWFSEITLGRIDLRRITRALEDILYMTLHNAMGQNSDTSFGSLTLGIKTRFVPFMDSGD